MKTNIVKRIGSGLSVLAALGIASLALGADTKESMCVKQKDGTYKCKASGKIMKEPCCDRPSNNPTPRPTPK